VVAKGARKGEIKISAVTGVQSTDTIPSTGGVRIPLGLSNNSPILYTKVKVHFYFIFDWVCVPNGTLFFIQCTTFDQGL
jgi:hypothetical protein